MNQKNAFYAIKKMMWLCEFLMQKNGWKKNKKRGKKSVEFIQSKRANITADPLLTNPLNSCTKLQISAT
jgi:hypothetical protein